ncbi:hypothetical protein ACROYT_G016459 [Oculina patagonica]
MACHDEPRCISYNYERSAGANGLCELNDCGVEDRNRDKSLIYSKGFVFQQIREGKYYKSCKEIQHRDPAAVSGVYKIYPLPNAKPIEVYCELKIKGGGFAFLPGSLTLRPDAQQIVDALFKDKKNVLLKLQKEVDRSESYTLIQPHPKFYNTDFGVLVNSYSGYTTPLNHELMKEYIFLGILPASVAKNNNTQGFKSNGAIIQFFNCDANPNSLFAFMPNYNHELSHLHLSSKEIFEISGVAVNWRSEGIPVPNPDLMMPRNFFFFTELHFGGCGCYSSSDRWKDGFNATAIGIR